MVALRHWNLKQLLFFDLCAAQCADPDMLLQALSVIGRVGSC